MIDEERLRSETRWKSLSDLCQELPSFPFQSFSDLVQAVDKKDFVIRLDSRTAAQFYPYVSQGMMAKGVSGWLLLGPAAVSLVSLAAAYFASNWLLLIGISIALISLMGFGTPRPFDAPFHDAGTFVMSVIAGVFVWASFSGESVLAFLCATFVVSFVCVRFVYSRCVAAVYAAVLQSEALFLYLFQRYRCIVQDRRTGTRYAIADPTAAERGKGESKRLDGAKSAVKHR